jgi:hypothetical protein
MSSLKLFLPGSPYLERDGAPVEFGSHDNVALVAHLAVTGERHTNEALTTLLRQEHDPMTRYDIDLRCWEMVQAEKGGPSTWMRTPVSCLNRTFYCRK